MPTTRTLPILLLLSAVVQGVQIYRAPVPSLDTVRFVAAARQMESQGVAAVLPTLAEQPLYPLGVRMVHGVVRRVGGDFPSAWPASAQITAALALVAAMIPFYCLARRLVGQPAAIIGGVLFATLGETSRLGADGLSDSTHLLFFAIALWALVVWMTPETAPSTAGNSEQRSGAGFGHAGWICLAGAAAGMALLARAEIVVLIGCLPVFLVLSATRAHTAVAWKNSLKAIGAGAIGLAIPWIPYLATVDGLTPKTAVERALGQYQVPIAETSTNASSLRLPDGRPMSFRHKDPTVSLRRRGLGGALAATAEELAGAMGYLAGLFAIFGLRDVSNRRRPVDRFLFLFTGLYLGAILWFATRQGYVSTRHLMPLVLLGLPLAGVGILNVARWLAARRLAKTPNGTGWAVGLVILCIAVAGPWEAVHASRRPHREAAAWLAENADVRDRVLDTRGWTGLYSGRVTYAYVDAARALSDDRLAYLVLECRELEYESDRAETLKHLIARAGEPVAVFRISTAEEDTRRDVAIYRLGAQTGAAESATSPR